MKELRTKNVFLPHDIHTIIAIMNLGTILHAIVNISRHFKLYIAT